MTRLNLYQEYSGGEQQEPTNQSSTINNDDVDNTEAPASVENVNVFTSDPSHPEDPRCNCTCLQGPPTQGCRNQERCECIDCFCFACNCLAQNALDVDDSPEQASVTLPALPAREGTLATLRRARENPQLARIAEQVYQVASAQEVPPRRREPLLFSEDELPVPIEEQMMAARELDNSHRYRRDTDPEDREPPEEWDDVCLMNLRRVLSSPGHHHALPHPAITPEPSNISPDRMYETLWSARAIQNVDNNFQLVEAAIHPSVRRSGTAYMPGTIITNPVAVQQAREEYHGSMADLMEGQGPPHRQRSTGHMSSGGRYTAPLSEQSLAELRRAGLRDVREEPRPNSGGEESGYGSAETLPKNASEHQLNKRRRTSYFGETD